MAYITPTSKVTVCGRCSLSFTQFPPFPDPDAYVFGSSLCPACSDPRAKAEAREAALRELESAERAAVQAAEWAALLAAPRGGLTEEEEEAAQQAAEDAERAALFARDLRLKPAPVPGPFSTRKAEKSAYPHGDPFGLSRLGDDGEAS